MYRMRMPFKSIDTSGQNPSMLWFFRYQVAHSTVKTEVTELVKYLSLPQVHLGIDPEFSLKTDTFQVLKLVVLPLVILMMPLIF
jgi:hypothetical protein